MKDFRAYCVALACICSLFSISAYGQTLVNDLNGSLTLAGSRSVPSQIGQIAFMPGDDTTVYVGTFGAGVIRYDYDPNAGSGTSIFSNQQTAVPTSTTNVNGVNGSLAVAFHNDPTLGMVMYIAPTVPFGGSAILRQTIVRLTDNNGNKVWGEAGEVNQTIVNNVIVSRLHQINNMKVVGNTLYANIGIRTQNGGQTAAQNQAIGGSGVNQSDPGETAYTGCLCFIEDLTLLSDDTTTTNLAGFTINGITAGGTLTNDDRVKEDIQPFISTDQSKLRVFATGFRNNYGLGIDDDGEIWVSYNENENPNAQDKLHRNVTFKSDNLFFKGNDRMGRWDTTGDEANGVLTVDNMAVLNDGWFDPANDNPVFALLGFNTAAGGMAFYPSNFSNASLAGDALVARNAGSGSDVVHVDEATGSVAVVLEGLGGALDVERDPFGNFIAGGSNAMVLLRVGTGAEPPPQLPAVLSLDFQGDPAVPGLSGVPAVTQNGFTPFNLPTITAVPANNAVTDPSITDGGITFAIDGTVGGFGTAAAGNDPLDQDFMFLGGFLGYDDSVGWTVSGLTPNTDYVFTWFAGIEGNSDRSTLIQSGAVSGEVRTDSPDLVMTLTADGAGVITGTATRNGTSGESNLAGLQIAPVVEPPDPSSFVGAHLAYGGSAFGDPESAFIFYPFSDGTLFAGPNDFTTTPPQNLFGGPGAGVDPGDAVLNIDSLPEGTYAFLVQENQPVTTEYELELITVQAPGSTVNPPTNDLTEVPGVDSISSDYANPTPLVLGLGSNTITGEIGDGTGTGTLLADGTGAGTDADYFTITVPNGLILDDIVVNRYNQTQRGFMVYTPGAALPAPISQSDGIAADKQPLLGGETATFMNYSSYSRGINRVVVDIDNLPDDGANITASDFIFRVGNDDTPDSFGVWGNAPAPSSVTVLPGFGDNGSDRIVIAWADNAIQKTWLQVSVRVNNNTALPVDFTIGPSADLGAQFYFGHATGEAGSPSGGVATVNFFDVVLPWIMQSNGVPITNAYDYDRDGNVAFADVLVAWLNQAEGVSALQLISPPGSTTRNIDWANWSDRYAKLHLGESHPERRTTIIAQASLNK